MIIGVSGYLESGKDTVGKIIQDSDGYYASRDDMGAGKKWYWNENAKRWEIKKYAKKLKQIASILTGIPVDYFEDQEFKKTYLGEEWNYYPIIGYDLEKVPIYSDIKEQMITRYFLQKLGTEAIRYNLHENTWVNALFADYKSVFYEYTPKSGFESKEGFSQYPNWIITDCRFPNEVQAIKDREGIVVRVNRYQKKHKSVGLHPSETSLDDWDFDYIIDNNGTIEELTEKVREMLIKFNLID